MRKDGLRLSAVLLSAFCVTSLVAATHYKIDINDVTSPLTQDGWTALNASRTGGSGSVTVDGVTFSIIGADSTRLRTGDAPNTNINNLVLDFVYDDGAGEDVGIALGGAGDLQAGLWQVDVYGYDKESAMNQAMVLYKENGIEHMVTECSYGEGRGPLTSFRLNSDGVSAYEVYVRENNNENRSRLNGIELRLIEYKIDLNDTNSVTETGWTGLDANNANGAGSVSVAGVTFSTGSTDGARLRGTTNAPNPDALLADCIYDDGITQAVILFFGQAGELFTGLWQADLYFYDPDVSGVALTVGFRRNETGESILGDGIAESASGPAFSHVFKSNGADRYDMFTRTKTASHAAYLNALWLKSIAPTNDPVIARYDMDDCSGYVSAGTATTTTVENVDFKADFLLTASSMSAMGWWGMDVPTVNVNVGRNSLDGRVWWSRGNLLGSTVDTATHTYTEFTLDPRSGYAIDFSSGRMILHVGTGNTVTTAYRFSVWLYRVEGESLSLVGRAGTLPGGYSSRPAYSDISIDLFELGIVSDPVTFRLYFTDDSTSTGQFPVLDTVTVCAREAVGPEDGTMILVF